MKQHVQLVSALVWIMPAMHEPAQQQRSASQNATLASTWPEPNAVQRWLAAEPAVFVDTAYNGSLLQSPSLVSLHDGTLLVALERVTDEAGRPTPRTEVRLRDFAQAC